jgi:hypothetical protein
MPIFTERGIINLDLHGIKHQDVFAEVMDFLYQYQNAMPLIIICGNSNKMIDLVSDALKKNDIIFSSPRFGVIRIEGFA